MEGQFNLFFFELLAGIRDRSSALVGHAFVELLPGVYNEKMNPRNILKRVCRPAPRPGRAARRTHSVSQYLLQPSRTAAMISSREAEPGMGGSCLHQRRAGRSS
jgi:hypothetical protein